MAASRPRAYCAFMAVAQGEGSAAAVTRRDLIADITLAAGLAAVAAIGTHFAAHGQHAYRAADAGAYALAVVAAGALAWRRRFLPEANPPGVASSAPRSRWPRPARGLTVLSWRSRREGAAPRR